MPTPAFMSHPTAATAPARGPDRSKGCRLVAADGRELLLRSVELRAHAAGGIARVTVRQRWHNPYAEALRVTYQLPLPADGAVSGYAFTVQGRRTQAQIARKEAAREAFEQAVASGHTAALLEQERSSLFTQELGNLPADEEMLVEVEVDQALAWLGTGTHAGGWEWRFPTVVAPRYLGADGRVSDGDAVSVDISESPPPARVQLSLSIGDTIIEGKPSSPSHDLSGTPEALAFGGATEAALDRDVVVRWPVASATPGVSLHRHRPAAASGRKQSEAYGLLTIVPPRLAHGAPAIARDLCVLLDVSGSMSGEPLDQARRVIGALIDSLDEQDQLELIAFSWQPERWRKKPAQMDAKGKKAAHAWLREVSVGGATEMRAGIIEALRPSRAEAQRQVLVVTDGLIGFESEIVAEIRNALPANSRVHTLGVGHSVNRSLTGPAARAGGGFEAIVAPGEDVEPICERLLARTSQPQLVELQIEGEALRDKAPHRVTDLFAGSPVRVALRLDPEGGPLKLRAIGPGGSWSHQLEVGATEAGAGEARIATLYARERVEDLELERASADAGDDVDARIEEVGLAFGISTRMTSWVAIDESERVDASLPTREVQVPHALAAGLSAQGVGLRGGPQLMAFALAEAAPAAAYAPMPRAAAPSPQVKQMARKRRSGGIFGRAIDALRGKGKAAEGVPGGGGPEQRKEAPARRISYDGMVPDDEELEFDSSGDLADEAPARELPITARVLIDRDGTIVIVFDAPHALEWDPESSLELLDGDGERIDAELVAERSTAAMSVSAGLTLRLVLNYDPTSGSPQSLMVSGLELRLSR